MPHWLTDNQALWWTLGGASVLIFVGSLILMPWLIARIPADYFTHEGRPLSQFAHHKPAIRLAWAIGKNMLGIVLILGGMVMLVTPGQGLLTIFAGFILLDFPGKYAAQKWLVRQRWVHQPLNWVRRKRGQGPLKFDTPTAAQA